MDMGLIRRLSGGVLLAMVVAACDGGVAPEDEILPDGEYELDLRQPAGADPWTTPGFVFAEPSIRFEKSDTTLTVTWSDYDAIELGQVGLVQRLDDSWNAHFHMDGPGGGYFFARFNRDRCFEGGAIVPSQLPSSRYDAPCQIRRVP